MEYAKTWDDECTNGTEILMYEGAETKDANGKYEGGDNPGKEDERIARCSQACLTKQKPVAGGSWNGFVAKGFVVIPKGYRGGRCFCESANIFKCKKGTRDEFRRYDWKTTSKFTC